MNSRKEIGSILRAVVSGDLSACAALENWPKPLDLSDKLALKAWTRLTHYSDDEDLLIKDPKYMSACLENLAVIADQIDPLFSKKEKNSPPTEK